MAIRRWRAAICIVPALLLGGPDADAAPEVTQKIVTYDVDGATPAEVRSNLNNIGPFSDRTKRRHDAKTYWHVRWRYRHTTNAQGCNIVSVSTSVEITITLPQLKTTPAPPPELARAFAAYIEKVLVHEKGHGENGIEIARRVKSAIGKLSPRPTCDELVRDANAIGNRIVKEEGVRLDVDYDDRTRHGRTQGATFP
jgi:predicted secreted Zn-dependent protease